MNSLLLVLQLLVADTSNLPFPYAIYSDSKRIDWKNYEMAVPKKFRDSVINAFKGDYKQYFADDYMNRDIFYKSFHFVDLNQDKRADVIYNGWTGGEANYIFIYYNHGNVLERIFDDYSTIIDWKFENGQLSSIAIYRPGCCDDDVDTERTYQVDSAMNFELVRQRAILKGMNRPGQGFVQPDEYFKTPVRFKTINNDYALRFSPEITDKDPGIESTKGNIIALFPKGAAGIAWARKKDASGREWWLVEMEPQSTLSYNLYFDADDKPTWYYGWMSSRFVEKL